MRGHLNTNPFSFRLSRDTISFNYQAFLWSSPFNALSWTIRRSRRQLSGSWASSRWKSTSVEFIIKYESWMLLTINHKLGNLASVSTHGVNDWKILFVDKKILRIFLKSAYFHVNCAGGFEDGQCLSKTKSIFKKTRKISVLVIQIHPKKYKFSNEFPRKCWDILIFCRLISVLNNCTSLPHKVNNYIEDKATQIVFGLMSFMSFMQTGSYRREGSIL